MRISYIHLDACINETSRLTSACIHDVGYSYHRLLQLQQVQSLLSISTLTPYTALCMALQCIFTTVEPLDNKHIGMGHVLLCPIFGSPFAQNANGH